jgi:hypothetical protein
MWNMTFGLSFFIRFNRSFDDRNGDRTTRKTQVKALKKRSRYEQTYQKVNSFFDN